jgi:hypothetical protein
MQPSNELPPVTCQEDIPSVPELDTTIYVAYLSWMTMVIWSTDRDVLLRRFSLTRTKHRDSPVPTLYKATRSQGLTANHHYLCFNTSASTDGMTREALVFTNKKTAIAFINREAKQAKISKFIPEYAQPLKYLFVKENLEASRA